MNKLIFILSLLLMALPTIAGNKSDKYKVTCTLTDGTVIEGYCSIASTARLISPVYDLKISDTYKGKARKYTSEEVKRIVYTSTLNDSLPLIYESVKAQKNMPNQFNKDPKPFNKPVFLQLIYEGKNVKGYKTLTTDYTVNNNSTKVNYVFRYYYLKKGDEIAKAYWLGIKGIFLVMKKAMKLYFREFPKLVEMVDKKEIKGKQFRKNPEMVLPLMDKFYVPEK